MKINIEEITVWEHELTFTGDKEVIPGRMTKFELMSVDLQNVINILKNSKRKSVKLKKINEKIENKRSSEIMKSLTEAGINVEMTQ